MQRLAAGELPREKYPCIVCMLETNSIQELHDHQKFMHTTEELSWSIICLVHFVCLNSTALEINPTSECPSLLPIYRISYPLPHSHNLPHTTGSNDCAVQNSIPYASGTNYETQSVLGNTRKGKVHEQGNLALQYSLISSENLEKEDQPLLETKGMGTQFPSSLELELSRVPKISDETFLKSVNGICKELQVIERLGIRRRGSWKLAGQTNRGPKRIGKRLTRPHTKFIQALNKMGTKGLQRSQTCTKSSEDHQSNEQFNSKHQGARPMDFSSVDNEQGKESGSGFDSLKQKIPVLHKASEDFECKQELREMPILQPQI